MADLGPWQPLSLEETARLFAGLGAPRWVAGGWAIDLFLGRQTRDHGDVDVSILGGNQPQLRALLPGWDIQVAHAGALTPWHPGDRLSAPRHQFWARPAPEAAWTLEFLLEDHDSARWLYRRDHRISLLLDRLGRVSAAGIPYICPEVALLFKSSGHAIERDAVDFEAALPALDVEARAWLWAWLRAALTPAHPGHPWTARS
jgi:hypothetical protein